MFAGGIPIECSGRSWYVHNNRGHVIWSSSNPMDKACLKICLLPPAHRCFNLNQRHSDGLQVRRNINFALHSRSVFIITFRIWFQAFL